MKEVLFIVFFFWFQLGIGQQTTSSEDVSAIPILELPHQDNQQLAQKELAKRTSSLRAPKFASTCKVSTSCFKDGEWTVDGNTAIWKLRIKSEGAESLNFGFSDFYLPPTAQFYITGVTSGQRRGPFVSADNDPHDQFWSPIIEDDEVLLELEVSTTMKEHVRLHLSSVNHAFFKFGSKNFSGSCNLDVVCTAADGFGMNDDYRDIIRSVVMYSLNGTQQCTGMLINNIRENGTPYIITADHCNINTGNASTVVAYYNYENSTCRQPNSTASGGFGDGPLSTFNTGATWISATNVGSGTDFNIIELDDPINPAANAFISGWNRESVAPTSAIAIHHPNTDEKRISYENDPLQISVNGGTSEDISGRFLRVIDWDTGTTEPGSSGSPLFDPQHRFIGQLFGGSAACGNNESDYYGRLAVTWEGAGSPTTRAKDYLDPDNIELMILDGIEASSAAFHSVPNTYALDICAPADGSFTITTNASFSGTVNYTIIEAPSGGTISLSSPTANAGDPITVMITNTAAIAVGLHPIRIRTVDSNNNESEIPLWISVRNEVPGTITTLLPTDGQQGEIPNPELSWQGNNAVTTYEVEVATDNAFSNIVASVADLAVESWKVTPDLIVSTSYYWRVRGTTACEVGAWSTIKQFTTGGEPVCNDYASTDVPKALPIPLASTTTSTLQVSDGGKIASVKVTNIQGSHTWISDLSFTLVSPAGTQVLLLANECDNEDNFDIGFADDATLANLPCPYTSGLSYVPVNALSAFQGESASGTWQLIITDSADEDGGQLNGWSLEICTIPDPTVGLELSLDNIETCAALNNTITVTPGTGFSGNVTLSIVNAISGVNTAFTPNPVAPGAASTLTISGSIIQNEVLTLRATDGNINVDKNIALQKLPVPDAAQLVAPADMSTDLPTAVDLSWQVSTNTDMYRYEIATDNQFTNIVETGTIAGTSVSVTLSEGASFFWRVLSMNNCETTSSAIRSFSTGGRFNIAVVDETATTCGGTVEFLINLNGGIDGLATASVSGLPSGVTSTFDNNPASEGGTIKLTISGLPLDEMSYTFMLTLTDDSDSTDKTLTVNLEEAPGLPVQNAPANNGTDIDTLTTFDFDMGQSATTHRLQVATDAAMSNLVVDISGLTTTTVTLDDPLVANQIYYWRVAAINDCGSSFSPIQQFQTVIKTSLDDVFDAESIDLVPNPATDLVELVIETNAVIDGDYDVYSINGQLLERGSLTGSRTAIDTRSLAEGVYLIKVNDGKAYTVKKLIIF